MWGRPFITCLRLSLEGWMVAFVSCRGTVEGGPFLEIFEIRAENEAKKSPQKQGKFWEIASREDCHVRALLVPRRPGHGCCRSPRRTRGWMARGGGRRGAGWASPSAPAARLPTRRTSRPTGGGPASGQRCGGGRVGRRAVELARDRPDGDQNGVVPFRSWRSCTRCPCQFPGPPPHPDRPHPATHRPRWVGRTRSRGGSHLKPCSSYRTLPAIFSPQPPGLVRCLCLGQVHCAPPPQSSSPSSDPTPSSKPQVPKGSQGVASHTGRMSFGFLRPAHSSMPVSITLRDGRKALRGGGKLPYSGISSPLGLWQELRNFRT